MARLTATARLLFASVAIALVATLTACSPTPDPDPVTSVEPVGTIESVDYHRYQSSPNYDTSVHTMNDPAQLEKLQRLLTKNAWTPAMDDIRDPADDTCIGRTSYLTLHMASGETYEISSYRCTASPDLAIGIDKLLATWAGD